MDIEEIRQSYDKVRTSLASVAPFISSLLARARIVVNRSVKTASISKNGVIVINPDFWRMIGWTERAFVLAHEVFHLAFRDHKRRGEREAETWNIICDAVNNNILDEMIRMPDRLKPFVITMNTLYYALEGVLRQHNIHRDDFFRMSKEEIYRIWPKAKGGEPLKCPRCGSTKIRCRKLVIMGARGVAYMKCDNCGFDWEEEVEISPGNEGYPLPVEEVEIVEDLNRGSDKDGDVLQDGDPKIYDNDKEGEGADEAWKEGIAKAYETQKMTGKEPAGLKRAIDELLKPKVDWRSLLRQAFRIGLGKTVVETWKRPSRKSDSYPGLRRYTYPTVWCLIDTSGSISEKELTQFLSEVYNIASQSPVKVICWDAVSYDIISADNRAGIINKVLKNLRGGGGTIIRDALIKTAKNMKIRDAVVVLTDGHIWDLVEEGTRNLFSEIASKASVAVFASTHREVNIPGWRFIKITD